MTFYTAKGDDGTTGLLGDGRVPKYHVRMEAIGALDEASAAIGLARVNWLEKQTDELSTVVEMPKEFILPGDTLGGATLSMARAIVRRAERCVVNLFDDEVVINPDLQRYLNRLSSLCFVLELLENQYAGKKTSLAKS